jgi:hypothetical protein
MILIEGGLCLECALFRDGSSSARASSIWSNGSSPCAAAVVLSSRACDSCVGSLRTLCRCAIAASSSWVNAPLKALPAKSAIVAAEVGRRTSGAHLEMLCRSLPSLIVEKLAIARPIRCEACPTLVDGHARGAPIHA